MKFFWEMQNVFGEYLKKFFQKFRRKFDLLIIKFDQIFVYLEKKYPFWHKRIRDLQIYATEVLDPLVWTTTQVFIFRIFILIWFERGRNDFLKFLTPIDLNPNWPERRPSKSWHVAAFFPGWGIRQHLIFAKQECRCRLSCSNSWCCSPDIWNTRHSKKNPRNLLSSSSYTSLFVVVLAAPDKCVKKLVKNQ